MADRVAASALGPVLFSLGRDWFGGYGSTSVMYAAIPTAVAVAAVLVIKPDHELRPNYRITNRQAPGR